MKRINWSVRLLILGISFSAVFVSCTKLDNPEITSDELISHIEYLASEELKGRFPGTEGDSLAADYIRKSFKANGLELLGEDGYQKMSIVTEVQLGENNSVSWNRRNLNLNTEFVPMSFSGSGLATGQLVFAGFGISIEKSDFSYDSYDNLDVKGKIVMILEGGPETDSEDEDPFIGYLSDRYKVLNAKDRGAIGVILVAGIKFDPQDELAFAARKEASAGLPIIRMKREVANELLVLSNTTIEELEEQCLANGFPEVLVQENISVQTELIAAETSTQNVVGLLAGKGYPNDSLIIVGGHYDHLGLGGIGTGTRVPDTTAIHYGADDNASGVSALIEIAGYLNSKKSELDYSVLFIAFAAEEMGLIGSKYYVENPLVDLSKTRAMVNLDMIGRLNEDNRLNIGGVGTAREFNDLIEAVNENQFVLGLSTEGYGPSDHASFYANDLPVLFLSTGAHGDYHTPEDSSDKIVVDGMLSITQLTASLIDNIGSAKELSYQEAGPKQQASARTRYKVTLGIMPDVAGNSTDGLKVEFVTEGRPAQRSGMQKGDKIVAMNGLPVTNIYDYMTRLQTLEAGQTVSVEILRGDKNIVLLVQL